MTDIDRMSSRPVVTLTPFEVLSLGAYRGDLRLAIHQMKFRNARWIAARFGRNLGEVARSVTGIPISSRGLLPPDDAPACAATISRRWLPQDLHVYFACDASHCCDASTIAHKPVHHAWFVPADRSTWSAREWLVNAGCFLSTT
jgi:hypothetical protein